jgi:hypothetical protein
MLPSREYASGTSYFFRSSPQPACIALCPRAGPSSREKLPSVKFGEQTSRKRHLRLHEPMIAETCHKSDAGVLSSGLQLRQTQWSGARRLQISIFSIARGLSTSLLTRAHDNRVNQIRSSFRYITAYAYCSDAMSSAAPTPGALSPIMDLFAAPLSTLCQ